MSFSFGFSLNENAESNGMETTDAANEIGFDAFVAKSADVGVLPAKILTTSTQLQMLLPAMWCLNLGMRCN